MHSYNSFSFQLASLWVAKQQVMGSSDQDAMRNQVAVKVDADGHGQAPTAVVQEALAPQAHGVQTSPERGDL
ncbi:hypothetical protein ON010_g727 [Phytophthora cinnamomi]|nr:hypothetical protein ON010_g727 [Phytophthora cinnamomi]